MYRITVLTFHDKLPVVSKTMTEDGQILEPLLSPLFRTITPAPSPLGPAPWITDDNKAFSVTFNRTKDRVSMVTNETLGAQPIQSVPSAADFVEGTSKKTICVCTKEFFFPQSVDVEDIIRRCSTKYNQDLDAFEATRNLLRQILDGLPLLCSNIRSFHAILRMPFLSSEPRFRLSRTSQSEATLPPS